jgi:AcrR family transcriptional regulator
MNAPPVRSTKSIVDSLAKETIMGVRERKEREKEQRRADILVSARQAFVKHGLEQTSMDRIAAEAELAKGTLYLYFRNRDELLMALMVEDFERLILMITAVVESDASPERKLLAAFGTFYDFSQENEFFYRVLTQLNVRSLFESGADSEPVCHFSKVNDRLMELVVSIVNEGIAKGSFTIDQPALDVVVQMMISLKGAMMILRNAMMPPHWLTADHSVVLHSTACLFIRGLASDRRDPACDHLFGDPARPLVRDLRTNDRSTATP